MPKKDLQEEQERAEENDQKKQAHDIATEVEKSEKFLTLRESNTLLYFDPKTGQYVEGESYLNRLVREITISNYSKYIFGEILAMVKVDTFIDTRDFTCPIPWINLLNGAFNLSTGEFVPRSKKPENKQVEKRVVELETKQKLQLDKINEEEKKKLKDLKESTEDALDRIEIEMDVLKNFRKKRSKVQMNFAELIQKEKSKLNLEIRKWKDDQINAFGKFNFTSTIPVKFDPDAECSKIDAFFHQVQNGYDNVRRLYELAGYCLWKEYTIKRFVIFVGDHDTGKSTTTRLLTIFLGDENVSGLSMEAMIDDKFDRIKLHDRLANISGELAPHFLKDTSLIKELTGRDLISVRLMHSQQDFKFVNYAKLIFLANQIPSTYENDDGYFSRTEIWEFENQFATGSTMKENILNEIATESELSGLFNKSVEALRELLKNGKFTASRTAEEKKKEYMIRANPFKVYTENRIGLHRDYPAEHEEDDFIIKKGDLFEDSLEFCKNNKIEPWTMQSFFRLMNNYLLKFGIKGKRLSSNGPEIYPGIYFKEHVQTEKPNED